MDYINDLAKQASQLTVYDLKSYYNQAKNAVLNVSEMEAKVREATNDDPWGASSTLMQQIADGTHNFQNFNEIMPTIYTRFMEKEAREWRQIYKALTLLEFLVKNGSERVVDDARAHISTIKMLRSFHYIDEKGKDQGINVRNRAQEIAALLSDVDKIRNERKKARSNKNKYQGTGNEGGMSFTTAGGGRYGGFGSDSLGGGGGGGGDYGGSRSGSDQNPGDDYPGRAARQSRYDRREAEYDEYEGADDFERQAPPRRQNSVASGGGREERRGNGSMNGGASRPQPPPKAEPPKKEVNLFDFDDDDVGGSSAAPAAAPAPLLDGDDDFDDFQTAPTAASSAPPPAPAAAPSSTKPSNSGLFDLLNSSAPKPAQQTPQPSYTSPQPNLRQASMGSMMSPPLSSTSAFPPQPASRPNYASPHSTSSSTIPQAKPSSGSGIGAGGAGAFDDLWNTSLSSVGNIKKSGQEGNKSMNQMDQERSVDKLWGSTQSPNKTQNGGAKKSGGSDFDDLLM